MLKQMAGIKRLFKYFSDASRKALVDAGKHPHLKKGRVIRATDKPSYHKTWVKGYKTGAKKHRYQVADNLVHGGGRGGGRVTKAEMNEASRRPLPKGTLAKTKRNTVEDRFRKAYKDYY